MKNVIVSTEPIAQKGEIVQFVRDDDFTVFLDDDKELDYIRLHCDAKTVIKAVALRRAQQIAQNYARKYKAELLDEFKVTPLLNETQKKVIGFIDNNQYCPKCGNQVDGDKHNCPICNYCLSCEI